MDKTQQKDLKYFGSKENIERVHVHVGIEKKNFQNTYLHNLNGKNKASTSGDYAREGLTAVFHLIELA